jgi:hypothetical protein
MVWSTTINLDKSFFSEKEKVLVVNEGICASTFLFDSGVHGLRIKNNCGDVVILPYQGQQIWSCNFHGHELAMKSMFSEPVATSEFLRTYGGFLLHCGATAMGVPSEKDKHPLHGELPNAPYQKAYIEAGSDEEGHYISLGGQYNHIVGFNHNYLAEPIIKIYEKSSVFNVSMKITNLKNTDMELMYLMHVNFRPVDNSELVYSANCNPNDVRVHVDVPPNIEGEPAGKKLADFLNRLVDKPELHHTLTPDLVFDPEILFTINYKSDEDGNAHSMLVYPDGYAGYISHRPSELEYGVRWIARTKNEDAIGIVLPATAEHKGYSAEKEKGHIKTIKSGEIVKFNVRLGLLTPSDAEKMNSKIKSILEK